MAETKPAQTGTQWNQKTLGMPLWAWVPIITGTTVIGWMLWRRRKNASAPTSTAAATAPTTTDMTAGIATDQYETLLSQIRDLQGNISSEPVSITGPAGPPGSPGPTGPPSTVPGPPGPAGTPSTRPGTPTYMYWATRNDHPVSLNQLALWNHSSPQAIISATRVGQPYDVDNPNSRLHQYLVKGNYDAILPAPNYKFTIPVLG